MVLGLRSKNKRGASVQVNYIICLQEIKPWPPSQSLGSLRSVLLRWQNGDKNSGSVKPVTPAEGKIEFNESFKLHTTFLKDVSTRGNDSFQKNVLELDLYEPKRDKSIRGQPLGTATIDLAGHGIVKEAINVSVPVSCKRSFRNNVQPVLYFKIQPYERDSLSSSSRESLSKEVSLDKDGKESVSALMNEEYAEEEAEIASFTDDDVSSHSSLAILSAVVEPNEDVPVQNSPKEQVECEILIKQVERAVAGDDGGKSSLESVSVQEDLRQSTKESAQNFDSIHHSGTLPQSSLENLSVESYNVDIGNASSPSSPHTSTPGLNSNINSIHSSSPTKEVTPINQTEEEIGRDDLVEAVQERMLVSTGEDVGVARSTKEEDRIGEVIDRVESSVIHLQDEKQCQIPSAEHEDCIHENGKPVINIDRPVQATSNNGVHDTADNDTTEEREVERILEEKTNEAQNYQIEYESFADTSTNVLIASLAGLEHSPGSQRHENLENGTGQMPGETSTFIPRVNENGNSTVKSHRIKSTKFSVRSLPDSQRSTTSATNDQAMEDVKEIDVPENVQRGSLKLENDVQDDRSSASGNTGRANNGSRCNINGASNNKVRELEHKVEILERELREAAAIEISLYSVVAEHGSSVHKVHTPARRLSRLYIHAYRRCSRERMANTAKSIISGLVLVAKSCGNDVPRLTFWLSNSVRLRAIVIQEFGSQDLPMFTSPRPAATGARSIPKKKPSPLRWEPTPRRKEKLSFNEEFDDWEDPCTFTAALERIEAWIFSRTIESIWWQTLTPHMQSLNEGSPKMASKSTRYLRKQSSLGDQQQANISIEIWKNAFADACERLCPVRAAGHECGCLPMLARLVMEQSVARLDVAMFNAILRESDDEIPTDPVSDPISDSKVLPIPSGKLSFGAGAQLKNAIGNWSRWLTDLFGMDMDDSSQDDNEQEDDRLDIAESLKSFYLLNALSDLLMLPKDMLLESSIRKEVCPTFSTSTIKRILDIFSPDEFCPDPIPDMVFESLGSEDPSEIIEEGNKNFPCEASAIKYSPPSVPLVQRVIGDSHAASLSRSGSSVARKGHTSDDELEELESPLTSIIMDKSSNRTSKSKGPNAVRYQLLREVWRDGD